MIECYLSRMQECCWVQAAGASTCCGVSSVVGSIGRAGLRKEVRLLRPGPRTKVLRHQMVSDMPGARSTRDTGNEDASDEWVKRDNNTQSSFYIISYDLCNQRICKENSKGTI